MVSTRQRISNGGVRDIESAPHDSNRSVSGEKESRIPKRVAKEGESHRRGINPVKFLKICFRSTSWISTAVNILWPAVPAAIAMYFARREQYRAVFALNYIAMVPTANLLGFAGQELARKFPKVFGVILETFLGSIVEIVLLMVLIVKDAHEEFFPVIQAAVLGSILANLLLCLGTCFFVGGIRDGHESQQFDGAISEVGSGLLLTAGFGLAIPHIFSSGLEVAIAEEGSLVPDARGLILKVSRATSIILLAAFFIYVFFQMRTHHGLFDAILQEDELKDKDRHKDLKKEKLTLTECFLALAIALALVSMHAVFLVEMIEPIVVNDGVSDLFMGLVLVPLVEKLAEHLTAIDEAWDNQMNFALAHVLGSTLQTALLNTPLVIIVAWGLGKPLDLNFSTFLIVLLILSIIVVGNFIRDRESNYLEGALCVLIYLIIAVVTFYFPNPAHHGSEGGGSAGEGGEATAEHARRFIASVIGG